MAAGTVTDEEWTRFHEVVNMTSRELQEFLGMESLGLGIATEGDTVGQGSPDVFRDDRELGHRVLDILRKRRTDLTGDDAEVMPRVVTRVERLLADEPASSSDRRRHRLMSLGHDPLKAG